MPFNTSSQVLYFDQNALTKAGLDPTNPRLNLAELRAAAQKIVSSGTAKYGMSLKLDYTNFELWMALGWPDGPEPQTTAGAAGRPRSPSTTRRQVDLRVVGRHVVDNLAQSTSFTAFDNLLAIGSGIAPITIDTSASLGTIIQVLSGGEYPNVKLGVGPIPSPSSKAVKSGGAYSSVVPGCTSSGRLRRPRTPPGSSSNSSLGRPNRPPGPRPAGTCPCASRP
jgi:ABC-type glycerol-3-phosphate transport system substrate-binding protein